MSRGEIIAMVFALIFALCLIGFSVHDLMSNGVRL